jgi:hypothetical protein
MIGGCAIRGFGRGGRTTIAGIGTAATGDPGADWCGDVKGELAVMMCAAEGMVEFCGSQQRCCVVSRCNGVGKN